jgi:hypothetical protein
MMVRLSFDSVPPSAFHYILDKLVIYRSIDCLCDKPSHPSLPSLSTIVSANHTGGLKCGRVSLI